MIETVLALFFGWLLGGGLGKRTAPPPIAPEPKPQPIPPGKAPPVAPYPPGDIPPAAKPEAPAPAKPGEPAKPEVVPPAYKPPGGWVPYLTQWSVARAKYYLGQPSLLPVGSSITETSPTGVLAKFRAESGKQHGDPKLKRAVTVWRQQK